MSLPVPNKKCEPDAPPGVPAERAGTAGISGQLPTAEAEGPAVAAAAEPVLEPPLVGVGGDGGVGGCTNALICSATKPGWQNNGNASPAMSKFAPAVAAPRPALAPGLAPATAEAAAGAATVRLAD